MNKLFSRILAKSTGPTGDVDLAVLGSLVSAAFDEAAPDRRRTDHSIELMVSELDQLNRGLEKTIELRTSELQQREYELRCQNERFNAAINNMSQGLCMFDADKKLVGCNSHYLEMYRLDPVLVRPGTELTDILDMRVANGASPVDDQQFVSEMLSRVSDNRHNEMLNVLADGRTISVLHQPMSSGGWVAVHQDITLQKKAEERIHYMAHHDALTGLPNRFYMRDQIEVQLRSVRRGASIAILCLDLDNFKQVNDTLGHQIGDDLLCLAAQRLKQSIRETDFIARLGGDEFAIILRGVEQTSVINLTSQRILDALATPFTIDGHDINVSTSIGISVAPEDGCESELLMKRADIALYHSKGLGGNSFSYFEPTMDAKMQERHALERDLRKALENEEFELFYQPILSAGANTIYGFEALLRWNHPKRGQVSPAAFIPVAEETGLIVPIGEWVIRNACAEAAKWATNIRIAINLSPIQFRSTNLVPTVALALMNSGINPQRLELEITETALLIDTEKTLAALHALRDLGASVSMDDFGTGYSSLSYLRRFPFDKIKIDQSFVHDICLNPGNLAIVQAVADLGRTLGMRTTAEGVETRDQLDLVRKIGCSEVQGYLFSRPVPAAALDQLIASIEGRVSSAA